MDLPAYILVKSKPPLPSPQLPAYRHRQPLASAGSRGTSGPMEDSRDSCEIPGQASTPRACCPGEAGLPERASEPLLEEGLGGEFISYFSLSSLCVWCSQTSHHASLPCGFSSPHRVQETTREMSLLHRPWP